MPGDGSCLYHARRACFAPMSRRLRRDSPGRRDLVEAPGTAPGSATLIPQAVYRHSRLPDTGDIGCAAGKGNRAASSAQVSVFHWAIRLITLIIRPVPRNLLM